MTPSLYLSEAMCKLISRGTDPIVPAFAGSINETTPRSLRFELDSSPRHLGALQARPLDTNRNDAALHQSTIARRWHRQTYQVLR